MGEGTAFGVGGLQHHPRLAALLGEFIARWSLAEAALLMPMMVAMGSRHQTVAAAMLAATNSTEGKIKLVKAAVENMATPTDRKLPIRESLKKLETLCGERNALMHHLWAVDAATGGAVTIDYRKPVGDPGRITARNEDELRDLCNRTVETARDICSACDSSWVDDNDVERTRLRAEGAQGHGRLKPLTWIPS